MINSESTWSLFPLEEKAVVSHNLSEIKWTINSTPFPVKKLVLNLVIVDKILNQNFIDQCETEKSCILVY